MTLLLQDTDVQGLVPMLEYVQAMEAAFTDYAHGIAVNRPTLRYGSATPNPEYGYVSNIIVGAVPRYNAAVVRIDSIRTQRQAEAGQPAHSFNQYQNRNWGLFLLYSLETCELLAIIHDFTISGLRLGATTALGAKHLARIDATTLGLFGSGKVARTNLEGIAAVRPLRKVKVFSPNREHCESFAREMTTKLEIEVVALEQPREVVRGVDILCCSTNAQRPVFDGRWLEPGQFVCSTANTQGTGPTLRSEVDEATFCRSDVVFITDKASAFAQNQRELLDPIDKGLFSWEKVHELGEVLTGKRPGRQHPEELIYFKNNTGMGIQFAAAGALVYQEALKRGVGHQLPTELFGTDLSDWYEKGYHPSA